LFRIFTRIRQSEKVGSAKSKFRKYLPYALGEIILITLGLVLALQINNWNNSRITKNNSTDYLIELEGELQRNLDRLHYLRRGGYNDNFEQTLHKLDSIGPFIMGNGSDREILGSLIYTSSAGSPSWGLQRNVYEEGVSTGQLSGLNTEPTSKQTLYTDERNRAHDNKLYTATSNSLKYHIHFYYSWLKGREDFMSVNYESLRLAKQNCTSGLYAMVADLNLLVKYELEGKHGSFWSNEILLKNFLAKYAWVADPSTEQYNNCLVLYYALEDDQSARLFCQTEFIELTENLLDMLRHEINLRK
jgi:hypothetical protein